MSAGDIKQPLDVFHTLFPRTYQKGPMTQDQAVIVNHERRIANLEKQVAELRAALNKEPTL